MKKEEFQTRVLQWFDRHGRKNLPWQQNISPYRVWVSEIMLQQTQVMTVIPYFQRFMKRFPDVYSLAAAPLDEVLSHWAGLGYYARARNLHKSARIVVQNGGIFPDTLENMLDLPGIGRSTAGAILSIACGQSQPILDGNVKRVLTRLHGVAGWAGDSRISRELWRLSTDYTPVQRVADYTQAMMDLGATLCTRSQPKCFDCPLASHCYAYREGLTGQLPTPKPRKTLPVKECIMLQLTDGGGRYLLEQRPLTGIWGGLWSLPEFSDIDELEQWFTELTGREMVVSMSPSLRHTFSHFHLDYRVAHVSSEYLRNCVMEQGARVWYKASQISTLGLPSPVRRVLLTHIQGENNGANG